MNIIPQSKPTSTRDFDAYRMGLWRQVAFMVLRHGSGWGKESP
jgi:hypothetical protein